MNCRLEGERAGRISLWGGAFATLVGAVVIAGFVVLRSHANEPLPSMEEATKVIRIVAHDRAGLVTKQKTVRDPARVRALLEAVSASHLEDGPCRDDYAGSDIDLVLSGVNAYARRTLHLYGDEVVLASATECARGRVTNRALVEAELAAVSRP